MSRILNSCESQPRSRAHEPVLCYTMTGRRRIGHQAPRLKPASQSYLHRDSQAAIIGVIFGLAAILITAKLWLIRLLG